ncbi:MAG: NAD(P)/FAD-dependent oxidoreductase [Chloroflexi bacterium]|nr:MAG: NAD(P)/FAD-dependent oxidoreductase [Chloroflexota bacterium]
MNEDVLVIGAGPAGLACAYELERAGISYRVIDRAQVIGSTWASLYPSLRLNTTRFFSHFKAKKFPLRYGLFPSGKQYHQYLLDFAREYHFNIHLGVEVYRVAPEGEGWRVESSEGTAWYPCVISATGRFGNPIWPDIPGLREFPGTAIHAHDYHGPEPFAGQRVMVIGNGPSGVDITVDLTQVTSPVLISIRSGIIMRPRYPYGLPKHVWMMIADILPEKWGQWLLHKVESARYKDQERYGFKLPSDRQPGSAVPYRGRELIDAAKAGKVKPVAAPLRFEGNVAHLADGEQYALDAVIAATGYQPVLHTYLDIEYECDEEGWPLRDLEAHPNGREVKGYPGLYLVGVFYKGKGAMYNFNVEAAIAVEQIKARLAQLKAQTPAT